MQAPRRPERVQRVGLVGRLQIVRATVVSASPNQAASARGPRLQASRAIVHRHLRATRAGRRAARTETARRRPCDPFRARRPRRRRSRRASKAATLRARSRENSRCEPSGRSTPVGRSRMRDREAARLQVLADRAIGGRGQKQHQRRRHHVMHEARRRDLLGAQAAADAVVALEQQTTLRPFLPSIAGGDQAVDAARRR